MSYSKKKNGGVKPEMIKMPVSEQPFDRKNFYLMGGCLALIIIGFVLMCGGGSSVEGGFNPDIFSTRRIVVGPTITFLGFLLMAVAIMFRGKGKQQNEKDATEATTDTTTINE